MGFGLIAQELNNVGFWQAAGTLTTFLAVYAALQPIWKSRRLGLSLYEDAVKIKVAIDGVLTIENIYSETIIIEEIAQKQLPGSHLGLDPERFFDESSPMYIGSFRKSLSPLLIKDSIPQAKRSIRSVKGVVDKVKKRIVSNSAFDYANTFTHLPKGMEAEAIWFVETRVTYTSSKGRSRRVTTALHRFSYLLEPRSRWIEVI